MGYRLQQRAWFEPGPYQWDSGMTGYTEKTCVAAHLKFLCMGSSERESTRGQRGDRDLMGLTQVMGWGSDSKCG